MTRIVNKYTIRPDELKVGDVMQCTLTLHIVTDPTKLDGIGYRLYQGEFPDTQLDEDGVAQGKRVFLLRDSVAAALFPTVINADITWDESGL